MDAAVKIIGEGIARRADVEATVEKMTKMCDRSKRTRSRESKKQKQFAKRYSLALRKVIAMTKTSPTDFRALPSLHISAPQLGIDKEWFDHGHLLRHLKLLNAICESWEKSKLGKPKPDAYEKRLAAEAALHLLKLHEIEPPRPRPAHSASSQRCCTAIRATTFSTTAERRLVRRKSRLKIVPVNAPRRG